MQKNIVFNLHKNKIINANKSLHHHAKGNRVRVLREIARINGLDFKEKEDFKFEKFKIIATICPPTRRRLDPPNLYPTIKAIIDGLTDAEWWTDDNFQFLLELSFRYGGLSGAKDTFKIILDVSELTDEKIMEYITVSELVKD